MTVGMLANSAGGRPTDAHGDAKAGGRQHALSTLPIKMACDEDWLATAQWRLGCPRVRSWACQRLVNGQSGTGQFGEGAEAAGHCHEDRLSRAEDCGPYGP